MPYFKDLGRSNLKEWKRVFWRFDLTIELIDTNKKNLVDNIFDRLNRNGEPLNHQELRNAKYHDSSLLKLVKEASDLEFWKKILSKLEINRMEHHDFISELFVMIIKKDVFKSDYTLLDNFYKEYCMKENNIIKTNYSELLNEFKSVTNIMVNLKINYKKYYVDGVSHLYGLWGFSWKLNNSQKLDNNLPTKLDNFYSELRCENIKDENVSAYKTTMVAATKAKKRRKDRINSLLNYCNFGDILI